MALNLYSKPQEDSPFSIDSTGSKAFTITFDGRIGGSIDKQIFIRNDNLNRFYTDIQIVPVVVAGNDVVSGTVSGFFWQLQEKDIPLSNEEWFEIDFANTLTMQDNLGTRSIGDISTYLSLWVRVTIPSGSPVGVNKNVTLRILATEGLVDG